MCKIHLTKTESTLAENVTLKHELMLLIYLFFLGISLFGFVGPVRNFQGTCKNKAFSW